MGINQFFEDVLGVKLHNHVWSWGAVDHSNNRVFLRVWDHTRKTDKDGERILVHTKKPRRRGSINGFNERQTHIAQIERFRAKAFGVLGMAKNPKTPDAHSTKNFDQQILLRLGELKWEGENLYAKIVDRVPVAEVIGARENA